LFLRNLYIEEISFRIIAGSSPKRPEKEKGVWLAFNTCSMQVKIGVIYHVEREMMSILLFKNISCLSPSYGLLGVSSNEAFTGVEKH
jgi:hypothetical protein